MKSKSYIIPRTALALAASAAFLTTASAARLASWTPDGIATADPSPWASDTDTPSASQVAANLTTSQLVRSNGLGYGNNGSVWPGSISGPGGAINLSEYTSFTLTPDSGYAMSVEALGYDIVTYGSEGPSGYGAVLRTSLDGFGTDIASGVFINDYYDYFDLTGVGALQNVSGPVEFRLYFYDTDTANPSMWTDMNGNGGDPDWGLVVDGSLNAAPESSTAVLFSAAGLAALARRRRKQ